MSILFILVVSGCVFQIYAAFNLWRASVNLHKAIDRYAPMLIAFLSLNIVFNALVIYIIIRLVKVWH